MSEDRVAREIVDAAYCVHRVLGPGLLESIYEAAMAHELGKRGMRFVRQEAIPVVYDGVPLGKGFQADLIVEGLVIVEIKSVESLGWVHQRQLLSYLRLADMRVGLLINFNVALIKDGITRLVNSSE